MIDYIKGELINLVAAIFKEKGFDISLIEHADLVNDLGMDSITFISMVVEIEAWFEIEVPDNYLLMEHFKNIDNIAKIINEAINSKDWEVSDYE